MTTVVLEAQERADVGKGASRRLRRLETKVPAIVYGGDKAPLAVHFPHNEVQKALAHESIYSSVFEVKVGRKKEQVILKDVQRHPHKPWIMHMDLQRVSASYVLVKTVPLHFANAETAKGVKAGGILSHSMNQVEVRCKAKDLPEYIEIDVANMEMNDILHLSDLVMPSGVELTVDVSDASHNQAVVSIHMPKVEKEPEPEEAMQVADEESEEDASAEPEKGSNSEAQAKDEQ